MLYILLFIFIVSFYLIFAVLFDDYYLFFKKTNNQLLRNAW